ncbi:hypothetical protein ACR71G_17575 [Xenorhabdus bovienii]|uniref:hypothetical protein n=1 Tax=Xenorhabdus bovienii TaxID=40576 RepID=UPI003DA52000
MTLNKNWLTLTQPNFFGQAHLSPNKRWIVGCNDSDSVGRGGYRENGYGRVILVDRQSDKVLHELTRFARPVDAAVSDTGDYIVQASARLYRVISLPFVLMEMNGIADITPPMSSI